MKIENKIVTCFCDNCNDKILDENEAIQREFILQQDKKGNISTFSHSDNFLFCSLECSLQFLEKNSGIRYITDDESECPKESKYCLECPVFNKNEKLCTDSKYWLPKMENVLKNA
jgi:hypothetical protein